MSIIQLTKNFAFKVLKYYTKNHVPRWVIFIIDTFISFLAIQLTFFLTLSVKNGQLEYIHLDWKFLILITIQVLFFLIFKSYSGIIRYTGFKDSIKQLQTVSSTVIALFVLNELLYSAYEVKIIQNGGVIIYGFIVFCMLFMFRVIIKRIYQLLHTNSHAEKAYFLGIGINDVAIAESIISDTQTNFNLTGFITEDKKLKQTRILTLPILTLKQIKSKNRGESSSVIVSSQHLKTLATSGSDILNQLLELNFKIYKLPELQDWTGESISSEIKKVNLEDLLQRSPINLHPEKLRTLYENKVILVSGAAGSIGSEIVRKLTNFNPKTILMLDQAETPLHQMSLDMETEFPHIHYEKIIADVRNFKRLEALFKQYQPQIVFHGAAYKHVPMMEANPIEALDVNFIGTKNMSNLACRYKVSHFVFVSSDKAVNPTNIMGASKRSAEIFIQSLTRNKLNTTKFITTRFGNVLGSSGSVIPHFKKQIEHLGPVTVTHPEIIRYFMTIDEACQLLLEAGAMGKGGEIYVFDMGRPVKIFDLAKQLIRLSGFTPFEDIDIVFTGLRPGEKLYEELLADKENTLPTHHQKILIAKASYEFDSEKLILLENFHNLISEHQEQKSIQVLKELVPEFMPSSEEDQQKNAI